jgi:hypothetical protein
MNGPIALTWSPTYLQRHLIALTVCFPLVRAEVSDAKPLQGALVDRGGVPEKRDHRAFSGRNGAGADFRPAGQISFAPTLARADRASDASNKQFVNQLASFAFNFSWSPSLVGPDASAVAQCG